MTTEERLEKICTEANKKQIGICLDNKPVELSAWLEFAVMVLDEDGKEQYYEIFSTRENAKKEAKEVEKIFAEKAIIKARASLFNDKSNITVVEFHENTVNEALKKLSEYVKKY